MPRKRRICMEGVTYHVTSRCIEKKPLMKSDQMKDMMIDVLRMTQKKYSFDLNDFVIMDNHFHFVIKTRKDGESISRIMQFIKSRYAQRYNWHMHRTGPFWNERFYDNIVEMADNPVAYRELLRLYLGFNPVRSGYVNDPRKYRYSSYNCYIDPNYKPLVTITLDDYFIRSGKTFEERAQKVIESEEEYRNRIFPDCI